jgi:hypothetical protein
MEMRMTAKQKKSAMYLAQAVVCVLMAVSYLFSVPMDPRRAS